VKGGGGGAPAPLRRGHFALLAACTCPKHRAHRGAGANRKGPKKKLKKMYHAKFGIQILKFLRKSGSSYLYFLTFLSYVWANF